MTTTNARHTTTSARYIASGTRYIAKDNFYKLRADILTFEERRIGMPLFECGSEHSSFRADQDLSCSTGASQNACTLPGHSSELERIRLTQLTSKGG